MKRLLFMIFIVALPLGISMMIERNALHAQSVEQPKRGINIGDIAPDIQLNDPSGKPLKLSALRGDIVLVDFWASWCRPCRMENPNVVAAYEKYKNRKFKNAKGFKIFSISLDQQKEAWVAAISKDKLDWKQHVSDLKGWNSEASRIYGVSAIPSNLLIDKDGKILAKNLRGISLLYELEKLAKN